MLALENRAKFFPFVYRRNVDDVVAPYAMVMVMLIEDDADVVRRISFLRFHVSMFVCVCVCVCVFCSRARDNTVCFF